MKTSQCAPNSPSDPKPLALAKNILSPSLSPPSSSGSDDQADQVLLPFSPPSCHPPLTRQLSFSIQENGNPSFDLSSPPASPTSDLSHLAPQCDHQRTLKYPLTTSSPQELNHTVQHLTVNGSSLLLPLPLPPPPVSFCSSPCTQLQPEPRQLKYLPKACRSEDQFLLHSHPSSKETSIDTKIPLACQSLSSYKIIRSLSLQNPQPLITVTINPMEHNEVTFIPPSPMLEKKKISFDDRKESIGSASSIMEEDESSMLTLSSSDVRRVSDISHINQLRREIPGMSHLASEFYTVRKLADPDNISLDSLHVRTLSRCAKYQVLPPSSQSRTNKYFVIITTTLTIMGISYGFWLKNFSGISFWH